MPVTFALLLLLSQATADPCYHPGGRPRFCLPPVTQLAGMADSCPQACALSPGTELGPRATCSGSLTLALGGSFLLTSVNLGFCTPGSPALVLSAAWAASGPWRSLWRRPTWPRALGGPKRVTFRAPPSPRATVVASHLRVEFAGWAGLAAAAVRGRCQCHGHAARCAARARPPRCRCRHHTTGPGCESCRPSHRDRPWRPATPRHPHPCLRESGAPPSPPAPAARPTAPQQLVPSLRGGMLSPLQSSLLPASSPLFAAHPLPPPIASHPFSTCLHISAMPRLPAADPFSRGCPTFCHDDDDDDVTFPEHLAQGLACGRCSGNISRMGVGKRGRCTSPASSDGPYVRLNPRLSIARCGPGRYHHVAHVPDEEMRLALGSPLNRDTQPVSGRARI